jgi:hypothetical protein
VHHNLPDGLPADRAGALHVAAHAHRMQAMGLKSQEQVADVTRYLIRQYGTHPPTRDFEKWDGKPFVYVPRRASRKQTPVLSGRTPRIVSPDIRTAPGEGSVCIVPSDIGGASKCPVPSDISRLPLPAAGEAQIQGSSTVRAPAQAGDAGSSPAPVANLTEIMLEMVAKLSPEVRMLALGLKP